MNCPNCNAPIDDQVEICPECGQKITGTTMAPNTAQQPVEAPQNQPERKWKKFFIASIILLVLGAIFVWIPIFGLILCVLSLVFAIIAKKRKPTNVADKTKICIIISAVFSAIALLLSVMIIVSGGSMLKTNNPTEKFVIEQLGKRFEFYDRYEKADLTVTEDENDQTTFYVKGQIRFSEYHEPSSYSA